MDPEPTSNRKRSRKDTVAVRRQHEHEALRQLLNELPVGKIDLLKSSQTTVLQVAYSYIKLRKLLQSAYSSSDVTNILTCDELGSEGFVLVVDGGGDILYASKDMSSLLGPSVVDTVGRPIGELLHPDDALELEGSLTQKNVGSQAMLVVRMRTCMGGSTRSPAKVEYKSVFVTCRLKSFSQLPLNKALLSSTDSLAAVMFCRTEASIGFPEIVIGGYFDCIINKKTNTFVEFDNKLPWILGYHGKDLQGKTYGLIDHPGDFAMFMLFLSSKREQLRSKFLSGEPVRLPNSRMMTSWGQWVWVARETRSLTDGSLQSYTNPVRHKARTYILGPDDSHMTTPNTMMYFASDPLGDQSVPFLDSETLKLLEPVLQQSGLELFPNGSITQQLSPPTGNLSEQSSPHSKSGCQYSSMYGFDEVSGTTFDEVDGTTSDSSNGLSLGHTSSYGLHELELENQSLAYSPFNSQSLQNVDPVL